MQKNACAVQALLSALSSATLNAATLGTWDCSIFNARTLQTTLIDSLTSRVFKKQVLIPMLEVGSTNGDVIEM